MDILQAYQQAAPRKIKLLQTKQNSGAGATRNLGLDIATGDYIGFVDSDDYVTLDYYEKLHSACEKTNSDLARTNRKIVLGNMYVSCLGRNSTYDQAQIIDPKTDPRYLITEQPSVTNKLFKKELIADSRFPEGLKWEDYPFVIPLLFKANQVVTVPGKNYLYNMNFNNTTCGDFRKLSPKILDIFTCGDIIEEACLTESLDENMQAQLNYLQIQNCLRRLRDVLNAKMPISEKRQLLTLISELMKTKYGSWQENPAYQEEKANSPVNRVWMNIVEKSLIEQPATPQNETQLKQMIKAKVSKYTKKGQ